MSYTSGADFHKKNISVSDAELQCRNKCGFYGNPIWQGYCSVCYRNTVANRHSSPSTNRSTMNGVGGGGSHHAAHTMTNFTRFEEKRKATSSGGRNANTVRSIFKPQSQQSNSNQQPTRTHHTHSVHSTQQQHHHLQQQPSHISHQCHQESASQAASKEFGEFLDKLRKSAALDISRQTKHILDTLQFAQNVSIEQHSNLVAKFYDSVQTKIKSDAAFHGMSNEVAETLMSQIERYITVSIHEWAFAAPSSNDEALDLELQAKIRSLHWITAAHLDARLCESHAAEKVHLDQAMQSLIEMNTRTASQDKLDCIVQCCKSLFEALASHHKQTTVGEAVASTSTAATTAQQTGGGSGSGGSSGAVNADEFLPGLIWLILKVNPTMLHSNLQFIMRFATAPRINSGESGYLFTNMCIAVEFIKSIDHIKLNMSADEFDRQMRGESTRPLQDILLQLEQQQQPDNARNSDEAADSIRDSIEKMQKNDEMLDKLCEKAKDLEANLIDFTSEFDKFEASSTTKQKELDEKLRSNETLVNQMIESTRRVTQFSIISGSEEKEREDEEAVETQAGDTPDLIRFDD